jgi:hypothetical protein
MDDRFIEEMRREPRPEFARGLRERLRARETRRGLGPAAVPALAIAAAVVLAVAVFTIPSVRASAQAWLDLFRVRSFAAVEYDESRFEKLKALEQDRELMVFDRKEVVKEPGPTQAYPSAAAAGAAVGLVVRTPSHLPNGIVPDSVFVEGAAEGRISLSGAKLRALLDQLELRDVAVPEGIDGKWVGVRKSPVVIQKFEKGHWEAALAQGVSPEVSVPAGMDLERLAEVGLRILGLDAGEARRVARTTDWRGTLMVPVPMNASTFRQVTIHGQQGLLITTAGGSAPGGERRRRAGTVVMWTEGDQVFGLMTNLGPPDAMLMVESVR